MHSFLCFCFRLSSCSTVLFYINFIVLTIHLWWIINTWTIFKTKMIDTNYFVLSLSSIYILEKNQSKTSQLYWRQSVIKRLAIDSLCSLIRNCLRRRCRKNPSQSFAVEMRREFSVTLLETMCKLLLTAKLA